MSAGDRDSASAPGIRLDKWLWAARFFKTRSLASQAVEGGRIHVNGQRTKPAHVVKPGDCLRISRGPEAYEVIVQMLSGQRRQATEAQKLYLETAESLELRLLEAEKRRLLRAARPIMDHRPNKRERRMIRRFT